jgi:hypothetical protein
MTANVVILIVKKTQVAAVPNEALRFSATDARPRGDATGRERERSAGAGRVRPRGRRSGAHPGRNRVTDGNRTEVKSLEVGREVIVDVMSQKRKAPAGGAR